MLARDIAWATGDTTFAATLVYGSVSVAGTASKERRYKDITAEGEVYVFERVWAGAVSGFATLPDVHQAASIDGTAYFIEEREVDADGLLVELTLQRKVKL